MKSLPTQGGEAWGYCCDLRDRKQIDAVVSKITEERSPIDILINNVSFEKVYHHVVDVSDTGRLCNRCQRSLLGARS